MKNVWLAFLFLFAVALVTAVVSCVGYPLSQAVLVAWTFSRHRFYPAAY